MTSVPRTRPRGSRRRSWVSTPLRAVDGFTKLLGEDLAGKVPESDLGYLRLIRDGAWDMHPGIPALNAQALPNEIDIWQAQVSLWIQEDIVKAVDFVLARDYPARGEVVDVAEAAE